MPRRIEQGFALIDPLLPISLSALQTDAQGVPYSVHYGDIYHSSDGAIGQARHVFLAGNGLPERWRGRDQFVILETGFGLGLNFLASWAAWRADVQRSARLHFVSIEKHPLEADALVQAHRASRLEIAEGVLPELAAALRQQWPVLTPGLHQLIFEHGAVVLTLALGDVGHLLPRLRLGADAIYLDGFSPAKNPDMWQPAIFRGLAKLARDDATLATYSAAGTVRTGLQEAGFAVEKRPGYGGKRDMVVARFAPRWTVRRHAPPTAARWPERRALVIGAGLAGCSAAASLAERGWQVTLLERQAQVAAETSSHRGAMLHPALSRDDNLLTRASRAGFWRTLAWLRRLEGMGPTAAIKSGLKSGWSACGVLERAMSAGQAQALQSLLSAQALPADFVQWLAPDAATAVAGVAIPHGGLWFPQAGWAPPPALCEALLQAAGARVVLRTGVEMASMRYTGDVWQACDAQGQVLAQAPVMVLANALEAQSVLSTLLPVDSRPMAAATLPLRAVRGQLSYVPQAALKTLPQTVVCGEGYLLPVSHGMLQVGASYDEDDEDRRLREASHLENLTRLTSLLPDALRHDGGAAVELTGFVGLRCVAPDRMPLVGALPDMAAAVQQAGPGAHLADLPRLPGLFALLAYGSRGLTWAPLAAECLVRAVEGEPWPIEADIAAALDPARFLLRAIRQQH